MATSCAPITPRGSHLRALVAGLATAVALSSAYAAIERFSGDPIFPYLESREEFLEELEEDFGVRVDAR